MAEPAWEYRDYCSRVRVEIKKESLTEKAKQILETLLLGVLPFILGVGIICVDIFYWNDGRGMVSLLLFGISGGWAVARAFIYPFPE
jgi:hypothetical protein